MEPPASSDGWDKPYDELSAEAKRARVAHARLNTSTCGPPRKHDMNVVLPDRYALFASPLLRRPAADEPNKSDTI